MEYIVLGILGVLLGVLVLYYLIYAAVLAAQRQGRRDQWIETYDPERASWLSAEQRATLLARDSPAE